MNIFKRLGLHFKVCKKFRPYFNKKYKSMAFLTIVENDLNEEIHSIYNQICALPPKKYKKDRISYERFLERLEKHNSED